MHAGTNRFARTRQDDNLGWRLLDVIQCRRQFLDQLEADRIALIRTVEGYDRKARLECELESAIAHRVKARPILQMNRLVLFVSVVIPTDYFRLPRKHS